MGLVPCLGLCGTSSHGSSAPFITSHWEPDGVLCPVTDAALGHLVKVVSSFGASPPCFPCVVSASRGEVLLDDANRKADFDPGLFPRVILTGGRCYCDVVL